MSFKDSWKQEDISPCCKWLSNKTTQNKHKCCKCGKEW